MQFKYVRPNVNQNNNPIRSWKQNFDVINQMRLEGPIFKAI